MPDRTKAKHDRARSGVFISYALSDGKAFAARLRSQLEEKGFPLWQDVIAMEGGRDWWMQITEALDHVEFMALVITPNALKSDTVRKEWRYARQQGVCVYPIKGTPDLDLRSMPRWMREKHFYDLDEPLQLEKFLNDLNTRCEQPRVPFMADPLPPDFVPRPGEFNQLLALLLDRESGDPVAITAALRGAGGYGKTTLAKALCHDEEVQNAFDGGILWVTLGENPGDLTRRVIDLIEVLTGERPGFSDVNAATARLRELLADRNALLVIDDVWDSVHLTPFTQGAGCGARLITTRMIDVLPPNARRVDVDAMRRNEAVALLGSGLPAQCETELGQLATRLGEWALLLELANRALRHRVEDLHQSLPKAIDWVSESLDKRGLKAFDARNPQAREQAVSKCLGVSLELLYPNERARFGELAIFPEDVDVPLATLAKLWGRTGGLDDFDTEALCERLDRVSLLQRFDPNARVIRLHDVVRGYLIGEQGEGLPAIHNALLESHQPSRGDLSSDAGAAKWADLPLDETYLWDHLAHHLIAAGRANELIATVKDLRYLAAKTLARKALAVEADLLAAENIAPDDHMLHVLGRSFVQSGHVVARCNDRNTTEATLVSRLQNIAELTPVVERLRHVLHRPFVEAVHPLPDLPDPALVRTLTGHTHAVNCCAITADGSTIVSASADQSLKIWDARTGAELRTLEGHTGRVIGCAISADGSIIVSASWDNTLKLWDAQSGAELRTIGESGGEMGPAISADGSIVVCASTDNELKILNARTGAELRRLIGHSNDVNRCAISIDGSVVLSASSDNTLKLWDPLTGVELRTLTGHSSFVTDCAISADGSVIVSASGDQTLKVWDGRTGTERHTLEGHSGDVNGCAISADGSLVVSASHDGTLKLWEARTGAELRTFAGHSSSIMSCAISRDGSIIVSASSDNTLRLWDARTAATLPTPAGHSDWVNGCAMNSDGSVAVSASADRTLKLWDVRTGAEMRTLAGHSLILMDCAINTEGSIVLSASDDRTLKLWDARTGAEICTLVGHSKWVMGCAISTDGLTIVSASWDKTLKLWDAITCTELRTLAGHSRWVSRCAISADGSIIISASDDHTLKVWDARTGAEIHTLVGHTDGVRDCAISADGLIIVSAALDNTSRLWDAGTGAELHTLKGHSDWLRGCAISDDGSIIVSASIDNSLKVWNGTTGECLATLNVDGPLHDCALQPDGERIVAAGARGVYFLRLVR